MGKVIWDILVQPLVYLIELVFSAFWHLTASPGLAIIFVSIAVNILCLPLYRMADDAQERERNKQKSMERWVSHIKHTFKGDEQYMMLTAYYTEQGYRPVQALVGSLSLLLQIPFFMAAYSYLSNLSMLRGASFIFLTDLGAPDGLLHVGPLVINVLPVLMTALNVASTAVYTRGRPLRDKVQAYLLAALFLVLLYDSPSGLVFYWTCNQLFSLGKNLVMKAARGESDRSQTAAPSVNPAAEPVVGRTTTPAASPAAATTAKPTSAPTDARKLSGSCLHKPSRPAPAPSPADTRLVTTQFLLAGALLTCLLGIVIPAAVMGDSPTEFVDVSADAVNPMNYVVHSVCVWAGTFIVWQGIYFFLSSPRAKRTFVAVNCCLCAVALLDFFRYGSGLGVLSNTLIYEHDPMYTTNDMLLNLLMVAIVIALVSIVFAKLNAAVAPALALLTIALVVVSVPGLQAIGAAYEQVMSSGSTGKTASGGDVVPFDDQGNPLPIFQLSRTDQNVVVVFLDRAISGYIPFIFEERPELATAFDGFTYYPNTISFGQTTNFGAPALYGGYEYTPLAMNSRPDKSLKEKHNEALLLLPTLFSEAGYDSVVVDAPYAGNYSWYADYSLYDALPNTHAYALSGSYTDFVNKRYGLSGVTDRSRSFIGYELFMAVPLCLRTTVYDEGAYLSTNRTGAPSVALMDEYSVLLELPQLSEATDGPGSFVQLANAAPHEPDLLQLPDYLPAEPVDNVGLEDPSRFTLGDKSVRMDTRERLSHYHTDAGALLRMAEWFDWMREQGVYDNTRIIIVSDHGRDLKQFEGWRIDDCLDVQQVNPLLMVKDFDAHGFETSDEFMTNADVPTMAVANVIWDPVNPFTGKALNSDDKNSAEQMITASFLFRVGNNNGNVFKTSDAPWYAVHDNIFDLNNWRRVD